MRVSWLESELEEQPHALARLLERQAARAQDVADAFGRSDVQYILIASRGSSSNAARYAQYLLGRAQRVPVMFATPSLYTIYEQPPRLDGALVLGISQSGASPDVASVLAEVVRGRAADAGIFGGLKRERVQVHPVDTRVGVRAGQMLGKVRAGSEMAVDAFTVAAPK